MANNEEDADEVPSRSRHSGAAERILDAAVELFLERGVIGANMDAIASRARSSKQTIYTHYADKMQIVDQALKRIMSQSGLDDIVHDPSAVDAEAELARLTHQYLKRILDERTLKAVRLCIEISHHLESLAPTEGLKSCREISQHLATYLSALQCERRIYVEDADAAARDLLSLAGADLIWRCLMHPSRAPSDNELRQRAAHAASVFMRAARPN